MSVSFVITSSQLTTNKEYIRKANKQKPLCVFHRYNDGSCFLRFLFCALDSTCPASIITINRILWQ